jgi:hypothetical protein
MNSEIHVLVYGYLPAKVIQYSVKLLQMTDISCLYNNGHWLQLSDNRNFVPSDLCVSAFFTAIVQIRHYASLKIEKIVVFAANIACLIHKFSS